MMKNMVIKENQEQAKGPRSYGPKGPEGAAIHDPSGLDEQPLSLFFQGYFYNRMTLLIFLIRDKRLRVNKESVQMACEFLDHIYRHMLAEELRGKYRLMFLWLKKFFLKLPDVTAAQRDKAVEFICSLYEIFGIHLNKGGKT